MNLAKKADHNISNMVFKSWLCKAMPTQSVLNLRRTMTPITLEREFYALVLDQRYQEANP
jgi:hypothetical protein